MCIEMSESDSLKPQRGDMGIEGMKRDKLIGVGFHCRSTQPTTLGNFAHH